MSPTSSVRVQELGRLLRVMCLSTLLGTAGLAAVSSAIDSSPVLGADSPNQLVTRLRAAIDTSDPIALAALLTPRARAEMAAGWTLEGLMAIALRGAPESSEDTTSDEASNLAVTSHDEAILARLEEILVRYGLAGVLDPESATDDDPLAPFLSIDHLAYLVELSALVHADLPEVSDLAGFPGTDGTFGELRISGPKGTLAIGSESFDLLQIDDRWYVSPPSEEPSP